jgi:phospholipid/cholesterol/gamma-HCH transport system ATP-binding protein
MSAATDTDPTTGSGPMIRLDGVWKSFGDNHVLRGVDLEIGRGESLVVIGGSGTGKSVLIKCIVGLMEPDTGTIAVDGETVTGLSRSAREALMTRFGYLFQGGALFDSLPVWENVAFGLTRTGALSRSDARPVAGEKLAMVGLDGGVADLYPAELSGGMRKRVALARAIATEPDILFFDEPTTGLDSIMGDIIDELIVACVRELGATAVTITHDMTSAGRIADRIAMLYDGTIVWSGPADRVERSGDDVVDQFVHGRVDGPIRAVDAV